MKALEFTKLNDRWGNKIPTTGKIKSFSAKLKNKKKYANKFYSPNEK